MVLLYSNLGLTPQTHFPASLLGLLCLQVRGYPPAAARPFCFCCALCWGMPCHNLKDWNGLQPDLSLSPPLYVFSPREQVKCLFSFQPRSPHHHADSPRFPAALALVMQHIVLSHPKHKSLLIPVGLLYVHLTLAKCEFHSLDQTRTLLDNSHGQITFLRICVFPLCVFIVPKKRAK